MNDSKLSGYSNDNSRRREKRDQDLFRNKMHRALYYEVTGDGSK